MNKASHVLRSWKASRSVSAIRAVVNRRRVKIIGKLRTLSPSSRSLAAAAAIMLLVTGIATLWGLASSSSDTPATGIPYAEITQLSLDYSQGIGSGTLEIYVPYTYVAHLVELTGNPVSVLDNDPPGQKLSTSIRYTAKKRCIFPGADRTISKSMLTSHSKISHNDP
jgi:hypothetical protein